MAAGSKIVIALKKKAFWQKSAFEASFVGGMDKTVKKDGTTTYDREARLYVEPPKSVLLAYGKDLHENVDSALPPRSSGDEDE